MTKETAGSAPAPQVDEKHAAPAGGTEAAAAATPTPAPAAPAPKVPAGPVGRLGQALVDYISGTVMPLIPVLIGGALFKTLATIAGPSFLGLAAEDGAFATVCNLAYNAAFYFMPILAGFSAAQKLEMNPFLGAFAGCLLLEPGFAGMAAAGGAELSVYGIPAPVIAYGNTLVPALLAVWAMKHVLNFFDRVLPEAVRMVFSPFFTIIVMLPVELCLFGPLGSAVGSGLASFFMRLGQTPLFPLAAGLVGGLWYFIVLTGMHMGIMAVALANFTEMGMDGFLLLSASISTYTVAMAGLAAWARLRDPKERALALGYVVTNVVGGVSEPLLYGVVMRYPRTWLGMFAGGFVSAALAAALGVGLYAPGMGLFTFLGFIGPSPLNLPFALLSMVAGSAVTFIICYLAAFPRNLATSGTTDSTIDVNAAPSS